MQWYYDENLWFLFVVQIEISYRIESYRWDYLKIDILENWMNLGADIFDLKVSKSDIICSIDCH